MLLAEKVGHDDGAGPRVGLRHVMGAYCAFHYPNHEKQLRSWGFVPQSWFLAFHDYLAPSSIGREELGRWRELGEELALFGREGVRLRDALGELYPKESDARRFLADAGLDVRLFTLSGSAQDIWFDVITKVGKNNQIGVLLATARKEYPKSPLLASLRGF